MRYVTFKKGIGQRENYLKPVYITVTLETDSTDPTTRSALNYLEDAIKAIPEKMGETAVLDHIYGLCEDCDARSGGVTCPAKSYLDVEVFQRE